MGIFALVALFPWAWENAFWLINTLWIVGCISTFVFFVWGVSPHALTPLIRPQLGQKNEWLESLGYDEKSLRRFERLKFFRIYLKPDSRSDK